MPVSATAAPRAAAATLRSGVLPVRADVAGRPGTGLSQVLDAFERSRRGFGDAAGALGGGRAPSGLPGTLREAARAARELADRPNEVPAGLPEGSRELVRAVYGVGDAVRPLLRAVAWLSEKLLGLGVGR